MYLIMLKLTHLEVQMELVRMVHWMELSQKISNGFKLKKILMHTVEVMEIGYLNKCVEQMHCSITLKMDLQRLKLRRLMNFIGE